MDIIRQTNRTILFEEFNPQKLDLLTLVGDVKDVESLSDTKIKEINEELLCKDFDEFLDKFSPTVYSYFSAGDQKVLYTLKKPESLPEEFVNEIPLNRQNDFLNMLFTLIDTKRSQGLINVDFKFENILDMISPKKVMEDIKQARKEIHYLYGKHEELEEGDPNKLELADKLNYKFEEASQNYNNVMAMLPLAIEDIKTRLLFSQSSDSENAAPLQIGVLSMSETGELKVLEAPKEKKNELVAINDNNMAGLIEAFEEDYDAINEDEPSDYVRSLVVRTFCPLTAVVDDQIDIAAEVDKYNTYLEFYKNAKDEFVKAVKPLVEKMLGVKMFFEQYTTKQRGMKPTLLITNTKLDLMVKSNNIPRLETFLNTVNEKNDFNNTVWLAIVPDLEMEAANKVKVRRTRFQGTNAVEKQDGNTMESLTMLLDCIRKYKIQTFFSFQTTENTTFNYVATAGVDKFMEKCEGLLRKEYSEYVSCCIPNFTIIPKEKSGVIIDNRMQVNDAGGVILSKEREDILKLWIEGVYISSAYVAAGIVAAYQCPEYLKTVFKNVTPKYPGIRFDIEAGDNSLKVITTMAQEITGFTNAIKTSINSKGFGFVFASENSQLNGKDVKQITVYKARTMALVDDSYDSVYKTLVSTYIERILKFQTTDFKQDSVVRFFSNNPQSQKQQWLTDKNYINAIIQEGDDLGCTIDDETGVCSINLVFNGNIKNLEVEITKSTSA
ncbi:transcriptional regulator [Anaeromicropila populeti]|uniref:Uncharacterized protein n=1 Tax=Anaeromicropila populeti TaxID=37658 RepID=A0A1I6L260_9FIRM|nr:transcriptional regulator [Anaeromicropila populeti]SFR97527.1 hypothetical protein SAMN05661086_03008 [Anaeromicropila populeti]